MLVIGWYMLLALLVIGTLLEGIALGLLSGLVLGFLAFSGVIKLALPPNNLIIIQASWFISIATLEAVGFFSVLERKIKMFSLHANWYTCFIAPMLSYFFAFCTGDKQWVIHVLLKKQTAMMTKYPAQLFSSIMSTNIALLISPLSLSGLLLLLVVSHSQYHVLDFIYVMIGLSLLIIVIMSILFYFIPFWLCEKLNRWGVYFYNEPVILDCNNPSKKNLYYAYLFILVYLVGWIYLCIVLQNNPKSIGFLGKGSINLALFIALILLTIATVAMLSCKIESAAIIRTQRFTFGIQQFFIFFGLGWFIESLIANDIAYLINLLSQFKSGQYGILLTIGLLYLVFIDMPIIIWLVVPLLIQVSMPILGLVALLIAMQGLKFFFCLLKARFIYFLKKQEYLAFK